MCRNPWHDVSQRNHHPGDRPRRHGKFFWVLGGMALGLSIAMVLGLLVFWAWPAYRRAKSPLGEARAGPVVLHYLKASTAADEASRLAYGLARQWERVVEQLRIPEGVLPDEIHVYVYRDMAEFSQAFSLRFVEEVVPLAVVDIPLGGPAMGALARLACALAYGGPGNRVFARGLAVYLDAPESDWTAKAVAYGQATRWQFLFQSPEILLPPDFWEEIYFLLDAPWASVAPTLELLASVAGAMRRSYRTGPSWEAVAAAFAKFVLEEFGPEGVRAFWLAPGWEAGAEAVGMPPEGFARRWEKWLAQGAAAAADDPILSATASLHSGKPSEALRMLEGMEGEEAAKLRAMAYLALGEPRAALAQYGGGALGEFLESLASLPVLEQGRIRALGVPKNEPAGIALTQAVAALDRARDFWDMGEEDLPERIVVCFLEPPAEVQLPWGVVWTDSDVEELPEVVVRFVLAAVSPLGLPRFEALVEGLTFYLSWPERDFREEAVRILREGRWVSLTQPLFRYPTEVAEAEAGALVLFLLQQHGKEGITALWEALAQGASPYRATAEVLGLELPELDRALRDWLTPP